VNRATLDGLVDRLHEHAVLAIGLGVVGAGDSKLEPPEVGLDPRRVTEILEVFALSCPPGRLEWPESMPDTFDARYTQRVVSVDEAQRRATGPRYFQLLVDKRIGSQVITQFIGHIPKSKAAPHRHLYEEAIIVLSGEGCMWTEDRKARVQAGDVIFLPRKQLHSLEATSADGIDVVGVICPGDNPSITYYD